jgi:phosphatidate cytidylyltransferase
VLGAAVLAATAVGGWPFALVWLAAGIAVATEWTGMTRAGPRPGLALVHGLALITAVLAFRLGAPWLALALLAAGLAGGAAMAARRGTALAALAAGAVIAFVPPALRDAPDIGLAGPLWMFAVVWATDIAAYFTGRALGGPKLWPAVSPKKTWSGFAGGLLAGTLAGVLVAALAPRWGGPAWPLLPLAALSVLGSLLSQGGDLGESALKRACGVKDSGRLIPGHGGVMDRLDGFFAVALLAGAGLLALRLAHP